MRTVILSAVAAVVWLIAAGTASAQNFYAGLHGGLNFTHDGEFAGISDLTYEPGAAVGGVFGYRLNPNVRFDAELTYRVNDLDEFVGIPVVGEVRSLAFLVNGYYDIPVGSNMIPYIGGGLGVANVEFESAGEDDDTVFAFQIGAGLGYAVTPNVTLSLDYRFFGTENPDLGGGVDFEYLNSTLLLGLRYAF